MRNCFVLGAGRSGTSMVTGAIAGAGYFVGNDLIGARPANPKGFFEDREVNHINEDLLDRIVKARPKGQAARLFRHRTRYGQRWLAPVAVETDVAAAATAALRDRIRAMTAEQPFCFKDPRFSYTLAAWQDVLDEPAAQVCIFREPGRTADSVLREIGEARYLRDLRIDRRRVLEVWTLMYRHILDRHRASGPWLFVHYDQVVDGSALDRLDALLGAEVDRSFADATIGRSPVPVDDGPIPADAARTYAELCALADHHR
jgi:hypothetical protein